MAITTSDRRYGRYGKVRSLMRVLPLQRSILGNTPWSLIQVNDNNLKTSRHSDGRECDRI
ncbi:MAG: hypothetical protein IM507_01220 [Microcystis sp. M20BS1]|uniref:hypothetical protein n=1 Tax=unclassified Microcystis TaxID=2643300 RepID=UPI00257AE178|nr:MULTISPECIES: hypothetical protein [unclassified Microcystis]MCA2623999.1 hypothetical protein [Microcystis sp. M19BS1]MCA2631060.1 hypothetical protein [Microcystis sp. M20BS1]